MSRSRRLRGITWTTALALSAALLSACTVDDDPDRLQPTQLSTPSPTNSFKNFEAFANEYEGAADELQSSLPAGVEFPREPPGEWEVDGNFEVGAGEVAAVLHWRCAWASAYVNAADSKNPAEAATALDRLAEWGELREVRDHSDSDTRTKWLERVVEPARRGDDTNLRGIQAECV